MKREWKTIILGVGVSLALYLLLPLLYGYLMLQGSVKESAVFPWTAASAGFSAAVGMVIVRRRACALPPTVLALLVGPAVQALAALLGFLAFPCGFAMGEKRWMLFLLSFLCALVGAVLIRPKAKKRRKVSSVARRRRG